MDDGGLCHDIPQGQQAVQQAIFFPKTQAVLAYTLSFFTGQSYVIEPLALLIAIAGELTALAMRKCFFSLLFSVFFLLFLA